METWFILAVLSAVVGGLGAFSNKVTAQRQYNPELVLLINSGTALVTYLSITLWFVGIPEFSWQFFLITFLAGALASFTATIKIKALHHIDSAIFLPLFKVFGPLVVIIISIIFFGESFNSLEWFGLIASLLVPILLISRVENSRQNNLALGLILVIVCAVVSAFIVSLQKFAIDMEGAPLWIMTITSLGMLIGSVAQFYVRHKGDVLKSLAINYSVGILHIGLIRTVFAGGGFLFTLYALSYGGPLGIVYTINSLYILLPIVLAIIFYGEHWNFRKALAIALSVFALFLLR